MVGAGGWELILFLWFSAAAHLGSPVVVDRLLRRQAPVRAAGLLLTAIGAVCWSEAQRAPKQLVALAALGSGAARALFPGRMISGNQNRSVHGLLMLLASVVCLVAFDFEHVARSVKSS